MGINSLGELCREADGEITSGSIRGGPQGSVRKCVVDNPQSGESLDIYESDVEGGDFMFGDPDGFQTVVTDVERVNNRGQETQFFLGGDRDGYGSASISVSRYF